MKKVAMFVTNPCTHDARVMKQAQTLSENNYQVKIFALEINASNAGVFFENGYTVERILISGIFDRVLSAVFNRKSASNARLNDDKAESNKSSAGQFDSELTEQNTPIDTLKKSEAVAADRSTPWVDRLRANFFGRLIINVLNPFRRFLSYYFFCKESSDKSIKWGADIVHCHDLSTLWVGKIVKQKTNVSVVYDSHELWVHRNRAGRKAVIEKKLDALIETHLIKFADQIITVCDSIGDWLRRSYPLIPAPVIIRNMPKRVSGSDALQPLKSRLGISESQFVLIYTGKITSGRGIKPVLEAMVHNSHCTLVILGYSDRDYLLGLKRLIDQLNIGQRVMFCDPVPHDQVSAFITGADLAIVCIEPVCLSYEYALPNKLFESVQAGIPILGSELVEIRKVVDGCNIGTCFNTQDDLVAALHSLNDTQLAQWKHNIEKVKDELSWNQERNKLLDMYSSI